MDLFNDITNSIFNSLNIQRPHLRTASEVQNASVQRTATEQPTDLSIHSPSGVAGTTFSDVLQNFVNGIEDDLDPQITHAIVNAAATYNIDPNLIRAIIMTESSYNPNAVSSAGAQGLMQLMPATARSLGVEDPFDIWENIHGGTRYLRSLLDRFDGDLELALAAYNAGAGNVNRFGGVPPFRETQNYIPRVQRHKQNYLMAEYQRNNDTNQA